MNLSMRGVLVKAHRTFAVGSTVNVWLTLPKQTRPITGMGSVVQVAGQNQMGIQLDRLTVGESERLQEYLLPLILAAG